MSKDKLSLVPSKINLEDPMEVMELLKDAMLRRKVNRDDVLAALKQVLSNYEAQNRVFMIAAANAELPRIIRLLSFINSVEGELFTGRRLEDMDNKELLKLYALAQSNLLSSTDTVKKVADMRLDIVKATGPDGAGQLFGGDVELEKLAGLPGMDSQQRDRVRKTVSGLMEALEKDDSVRPDDAEDDEDAAPAGDPEDQE